MYIVVVSHIESPEKVEPHFKKHCEWLHKHVNEGTFIASGPKKNHLGGVFLVRSMDKAQLQKILETDSYYQANVADYQIIDMDFKLAGQGFEKLVVVK